MSDFKMEKIALDVHESSLFMRRKKAAAQAQERNSNSSSPHHITSQAQHHTVSSHHNAPQTLPQHASFSHLSAPQPPAYSHHVTPGMLPQPQRASSHHITPQSLPLHDAPSFDITSQQLSQPHTASSQHLPLYHTSTLQHPKSSQKIPIQRTSSNPNPSHSPSRPQHLPLKNIAAPQAPHPFPLHVNESSYGVPLKSSGSSQASYSDDVTRRFPPNPKGIPPPKPPRQMDMRSMNHAGDVHLRSEVKNKYLANLDYDQALNDSPPDFCPPPIGSRKETNLHSMSLDAMSCTRCGDGFEPQEKIVNSNGQLWHTQCFVCAQCFRPFPDDIFYEFEGRKYCEHDFQVLFAPCCNKCNEFIIGRVIKAMSSNWHPQCFTCELCHKELADLGFIRNAGRALCHECNARVKAESQGKYMCHKCHSTIDGQPLRWRGDTFHPYHFNCASCGTELTADAREVKSRPGYTANEMNELYCLRCHDKMGIPICGACRRPIEERVVTALGKHWHVEHFVCAKCEKPFMGNRHYERKGLAYCETHYHELFGNLCFVCNTVIYGDVVTALNKAWCQHHFACTTCDAKMTQKTKFFEFDQKPICKKCYEKFPQELKKRLKKQHDIQARGGKPLP